MEDVSSGGRVERDARRRSRPRSRSPCYILVALLATTLGAATWLLLLRTDDASKGEPKNEERTSVSSWAELGSHRSQFYDEVLNEGDEYFGSAAPNEYDSTEVDPGWYPHPGDFEGSGCHSPVNKSGSILKMDEVSAESSDGPPSVPVNISFADLAAAMIPPYFQRTIDLCLSTIVPAVSALDTNETTSVMPGDVCLLRKTLLKTRDLFNTFCPVYPNSSSPDDYLHGADEALRDSNSNDSDGSTKMTKNKVTRFSFDENKTTGEVEDLWGALYHQLISGYELLGDFQDLDHANITYTADQLVQYQREIWMWREGFVSIVEGQGQYIQLYLSQPCMTNNDEDLCRFVHSSSHLFWDNATGDDLPDGRADRASSALGRLGSVQLERAATYLTQSLAHERVINVVVGPGNNVTLNDDAHFDYHNFRKELRSFMDSAVLFGNLFLPGPSSILKIRTSGAKMVCESFATDVPLESGAALRTDQVLCSLHRARKLLGDLNDEYVAYARYFDWGEYPEERSMLEGKVEARWSQFRSWVGESGLFEKIQFLRDGMDRGASSGEDVARGRLAEKL